MSKQEMMTMYERWSAAHTYILGFVYNGKLYFVKLAFAELARYFKLDRASSKRGGFAKIRIRMTADERRELVAVATLLGSADLLEADAKYNKGENFEKVITERLAGMTWVKDSVPFNVAGDVELNGEQVQVKLDNAELTNEKLLSKLLATA